MIQIWDLESLPTTAETALSLPLKGCGLLATRAWAAEHCHLVALNARFPFLGLGHKTDRLSSLQGVSQKDPYSLHPTHVCCPPCCARHWERGRGLSGASGQRSNGKPAT